MSITTKLTIDHRLSINTLNTMCLNGLKLKSNQLLGDKLHTNDNQHRSNLHHSNNVQEDHLQSEAIPTQTERNNLRSSYQPTTTTTTQSSVYNDEHTRSSSVANYEQPRSTNYPVNVINNVYRYQNGFNGIGPELDPARQYAQIESYGLNLQKGSQKFLPKLPSPAFAEVLGSISHQNVNNQNSPNSQNSPHNQNEFVNSGDSNRKLDEDRFKVHNYEPSSNNQNEFNEPIAVHVHNHREHLENNLSPVANRAQQANSGSDRRTPEINSTPIRETVVAEQYAPPTQPPTTFETTRHFDTTITRTYDTTVRTGNQQPNTFNPNPIITTAFGKF